MRTGRPKLSKNTWKTTQKQPYFQKFSNIWGALPPDPHYRLALHARHMRGFPLEHFRFTPKIGVLEETLT